jgi:dTDP-4-amino-4,6-dideoxygalactose transaminase
MGDAGCFSFYATKNITTVEGGMVISANDEFLSRVRRLSMHGLSADAHSRSYDNDCLHYTVEAAGFKYNMTDLQAAFGIHQLKRIEEYWAKRKQIWDFYLEEFKDLPVTLPFPDEAGTKNACHLFTLGIDPLTCGMDRDEFIHRLHRLNIGCGVHYQAIPSHAFYRKAFHFREEEYPHAVNRGKQTVSIPLSPKLTEQDAEDVAGAVKEAVNS